MVMEDPVQSLLWPVLKRYVKLVTDYGRTDVVRDRFDAGGRREKLISKDMIALRIGPDVPMSVVRIPSLRH